MAEGKNDLLRMTKLTLQNFRCFEHKEVEFAEQFNVLIGDNGAGKTAVLDALAIGLSEFLDPLVGDQWWLPRMSEDDVRLCTRETRGLPENVPQHPSDIAHQFLLSGDEIDTRMRFGGSPPDMVGRLSLAADRLHAAAVTAGAVPLPVAVYYGPGKASPEREAPDYTFPVSGRSERTRGYGGCLAPRISDLQFTRWFATLSLAEIQEGSVISPLAAVKRAIGSCVEGCDNVYWWVRYEELFLKFTDGHMLPYRMLSHGQRNMLAMVADIAWRTATLNPDLDDPVTQTPGIVLIDEIDLHLHPKWQRRVVNDLRRTFPLVQFIATTHSPFIVQGLRPGELINLDRPVSSEYWKGSPEDIVEEEMGVELPQRGERYQEMAKAAEEYYRLLRQGESASAEEKARLRARLDELEEPFSDDVAFSTFLHMERLAAGLGEVTQ